MVKAGEAERDIQLDPQDYFHRVLSVVRGSVHTYFKERLEVTSRPNVTLLLYDPFLRARFHITLGDDPAGNAGLPGIDAPLHQKLVDGCKEVIEPLLSKSETATLYRFAEQLPHMESSLRRLVELGVHKHLDLPDDRAILLWDLLEILNKAETERFREIPRGRPLYAVVQTLLSCIPQFDGIFPECPPAFSGNDGYVASEMKTDDITEQLAIYKSENGRLSFGERLFFMLSLVESLQWPLSDEFGFYVVKDLKAMYGESLKHLRSEAATRGRLGIQGNTALCLQLSSFYLYGSDIQALAESRNKTRLRQDLTQVLDDWMDMIADISEEKCLQQCMLNPRLRERPAFAFLHSLACFFAPSKAFVTHFLPGQPKSYRLVLRSRNDVDPRTGRTQAASDLLLDPWGLYSTDEIGTDNTETADLRRDGQEHVRVGPKTLTLLLRDHAGVPFGVRLEFARKGFFDGQKLETPIRNVVQRLNRLHQHVQLDTGRGPWYAKAFGRLYLQFDIARQEQEDAPYYYERQNEDTFLKALMLKRAGEYAGDDLTWCDLGIGYGRAQERLHAEFEELSSWTTHGVDLSHDLLREAERRLRPKLGDRLFLHSLDLRSLETFLDGREEIADVVTVLFTTFGCFASPQENGQLLVNAYRLLRPGGYLVVDQYNPSVARTWEGSTNCPLKTQICKHTEFYAKTIGGIRHELVITRNYQQLTDTGLTNYNGHYFYFRKDDANTHLIQCDRYSLCLYHRPWFENQIAQLIPAPRSQDVEFFGSFEGEKDPYKDGSDQRLMVIQIKKPPKDALSQSTAIGAANALMRVLPKMHDTLSGKRLGLAKRILKVLARLGSPTNEVLARVFIDNSFSAAYSSKLIEATEGDCLTAESEHAKVLDEALEYFAPRLESVSKNIG